VVLDPLITQAYPLAEWRAAFERTASADCMKLVIDPRLGVAAIGAVA
jgi:threonine dehydrogenase-like Zn-dependent dehydrogenase